MRLIVPLCMSLLLIAVLAVVGCAPSAPAGEPPTDIETEFAITSPAFAEGAEIPVKYSCDGENVSPPLDWSQGPAGTASFALIVDDPEAGGYTHWVIFNLPPDARGLPEDVPKDEKLASGALQGKIASGGTGYPVGYFGPCPYKGSSHPYKFTLYALDTSLDLAAGVSKEQVLEAMQGHILAQSQLIGVYTRR